MHRRHFLSTVGGAFLASPLLAIEPIVRPAPARMRLSLAAYSFQRDLNLKGKTPPKMTLPQFIDYAGTLPLDAVELTSYYFAKSAPADLAAIKGQCTKLGLDVSGSAVGNNFCLRDPAKIEAQLADVKAWIEKTSLLGGKTLRIFAGTLEKGEDEAKAVGRCVDLIQQACDHAAKFGIFLALENHGGITGSAEQLLSIVKAVKHDWFGVNVDTGNFRTADPYADLAKIAPYAVNVQLKTEIAPMGQKKQDADLAKLIGILKDVNYRGYVALEYEAEAEPRMAIPPVIDQLRRLIAS